MGPVALPVPPQYFRRGGGGGGGGGGGLALPLNTELMQFNQYTHCCYSE